MMNWHTLRKRSYVFVAALAIIFVAGTLTSTAYAKFKGPDVQARNFNVTYVGVTDPVDSLPNDVIELVLTQTDGEFVSGRRSEMTVSIMNHDMFGTSLLINRPCNEAGDLKGWCINEGKRTWVAMPQVIHRPLSVDGTDIALGPGLVKQITDGAGYEGMASYKSTFQFPDDTLNEGVIVTINIDGVVSKMKSSEGEDRSKDKRQKEDD